MNTLSQRAAERAGRIVVRRYASAAEADRHELSYWSRLSDAERVQQVWRLSRELWELRGARDDEPGLCRLVASVQRR